MTNWAMLSALRSEMILRRVNPGNPYLLNNGNAYVSNYKYSTLWQRITTQYSIGTPATLSPADVRRTRL